MRRPFNRRTQALYLVVGYFAPLAGAVLGIVFVAINGSKFGHNKVPVKIGDDLVMMDGPPEYYLICFWFLAVMQVVYILLNIMGGPCSCERRCHFPVQASGMIFSLVYLVMANTSASYWPEGAQVWSPRVYFNVSALLMLCGQGMLVWGAFRLSGSGCSARSDEEEMLQTRMKRFEKFAPVWGRKPGQGAMRLFEQDDEAGSSGEDGDDPSHRILQAYPNNAASESLRMTGRMGFTSSPFRGGPMDLSGDFDEQFSEDDLADLESDSDQPRDVRV